MVLSPGKRYRVTCGDVSGPQTGVEFLLVGITHAGQLEVEIEGTSRIIPDIQSLCGRVAHLEIREVD